MSARSKQDLADDRGVSLTELVVYVALLGLVALVAGSILISTFRSEQLMTQTNLANNRGQLISTSISEALRDSSAYQSGPVTAEGQLLVAKVGTVGTAGSSSTCRAWFFSSSGDVYTRTANGVITAPGADLSGWSWLAGGVTPQLGGSYVTPNLTVAEGSSRLLEIAFAIEVQGEGTVIAFQSAIANRAQTGSAVPTCF